MIRNVSFIQKNEDLIFLLLGGSGQIFGPILFYFYYFISMVIFKNMADNNLFFEVLAELGYFKCFYILLFFPLRGVRPLVENSTNFIFFIFETLPYLLIYCISSLNMLNLQGEDPR